MNGACILLLTCLCFIWSSVIAQQVPKIDSSRVSSYYFYSDSLEPSSPLPYDTLLEGVQQYDPILKQETAFAHLGNTGLAHKSLLPQYLPNADFDPGIHIYDQYLFHTRQIQYFHHYYPFTDIHYVMGRKKEQFLELIHSQNIGNLFTAQARVRIINSPGFYTRQKSEVSNLLFSAVYQSKNQRYKASGGIIQNTMKLQQNGGITSDSVFENNQEADRRVIPVNLPAAQDRLRETSGFVWQEYLLVKDENKPPSTLNRYLPLLLRHSLYYTDYTLVYEDPFGLSAIYPFYPVDSIHTQDRLSTRGWNTRIAAGNPDTLWLHYSLGMGYENKEVANGTIKDHYRQWTSFWKLNLRLPMHFNGQIASGNTYGGYQDKDYYVESQLAKSFFSGKKHRLTLTLQHRYSVETPSWVQQHYQSNLISWNKNLIQQKIQFLGASFRISKLQAGYQQYRLEHLVVNLAGTSEPWQVSEPITLQRFFVELPLRYRGMGFISHLDYQAADKDTYLHLPKWILRHSLYGNLRLFKGALSLQPGVDLYYQSGYYADLYLPSTHSFYLQYDQKLNDQVYADFFINMKIGQARIFVKYQHFNAFMGNSAYYQVPHYPVQDAAFKFGINWLLRDGPDREKKFEDKEEK